MKIRTKLSIVLRRLRLSHLVLASTAVPLTASAISLLRGNVPLFGLNLAITCGVCFVLFYVEAKHMSRSGLL